MSEIRGWIEEVEGEVEAFYSEVSGELKAVLGEVLTLDEAVLGELQPLRADIETLRSELTEKLGGLEVEVKGLIDGEG